MQYYFSANLFSCALAKGLLHCISTPIVDPFLLKVSMAMRWPGC